MIEELGQAMRRAFRVVRVVIGVPLSVVGFLLLRFGTSVMEPQDGADLIRGFFGRDFGQR